MKKIILYCFYCFLLGCCIKPCDIELPQLNSPFFSPETTWSGYIKIINEQKKEALCEKNESILFIKEMMLLQNMKIGNNINFNVKIKEAVEKQKFVPLSLDKKTQEKVGEIWEKIIRARKKNLYLAVSIAELKTSWNENEKNCRLSDQDIIIKQNLENIPTIFSLELEIKELDILYDVCHQLSLNNFNITFPY